ncbi:alpha/beta hydrolase [Stutzerimonas stutzeri]
MSFASLHRAACVVVATAALAMFSATASSMTHESTATAPDGVTLSIHETGNPSGPPIIFIHGLLGSHLNWDAQVQSELAQRYRLISYDLRGHGRSAKPVNADAYRDGRRWADDLNAVIDATRAERPVLVGWSLGATVISNYLATYGDAQIAGAVYVDGVIELASEQIVPHPEVYKGMASSDLRTHLDAERKFLALCFEVQPAQELFERSLAAAAIASWDMQQVVQSMTVDVVGGLGRASVPVLMLYGAKDDLIKADVAIARARVINPSVRTMLYEHSGHAPFVEEPARFNRDIAAFVDHATAR